MNNGTREAVQQTKFGRKKKMYNAINQKRRKIFAVKTNSETASKGAKNISEKEAYYSTILFLRGELIGLRRYLATYWTEKNIRINAFCPGGIQ